MAFADVDIHEIEEARANRNLLDKYQNQLSMTTSDAWAMEAKAPIHPARPDTLRLYLRRWTEFHKKTLGNQCDIYVAGKAVAEALLRKGRRIKESPQFMVRRGPFIMWELTHMTYDFYQTIKTVDDFATAEQFEEAAPKAMCDISVPTLLSLEAGPTSDLPRAWIHKPTSHEQPQRDDRTPNRQKPTGGNNQQDGMGRNQQQQQTQWEKTASITSAWAPAFTDLFSPFTDEQRRKTPLKLLLEKSGKDLKWLCQELNTGPRQCMKSVVFGLCPNGRKLNHSPTPPQPVNATKVAAIFKPHLPTVVVS